jgi:polysaccharide biosynthesis/export protein
MMTALPMSPGMCRLAMALALAAITACTTTPPDQAVLQMRAVEAVAASAPTEAGVAGDRYRINVNDELDIAFPDRPDMNQVVRVRPDGRISMRLIQSLPVEGRTPAEVEADIAQRYREVALPPSVPAGALAQSRYVIGVGDELEIKFPYHRAYDQTVKVRPDGKISLSLVKTVVVEGKTPEDLEAELNRQYRTFLRQPDLTVIVRNFAENRLFVGDMPVRPWLANLRPVVIVRSFAAPQVFVGGEVGRPGVLPFRGRMTALSAIVEAGGYKSSGQLNSVLVLRRGGRDEAVVIRRDLTQDRDGAGTNDVYLEPFDVVLLPKTQRVEIGEYIDQLLGLFPPLRNIGFSFVREVRRE